MNEHKFTEIYVMLFVVIVIILLMIISFIIKDIVIVALLHLISGSVCIALLIDKLNDIIHGRDNK